MPKHFAIVGLVALFAAETGHTDCRGCCSHHGGVRCIDGKTKCADGKPLSYKCRAKGCDKCGYSTTAPSPTGPTTIRDGGYNRKDWPHWIDADGDCQDTRAEILIRDNVGQLKWKRNKPCNVSWGRWVCPYTGKVLTKASDVDIDHIVPLAHAYVTGGALWTREQKRAFANDPDNLLAVDDATNQEKGDKGPSEWKPPQRECWPVYARKWKSIKTKYGLTTSASERRSLIAMEGRTGHKNVQIVHKQGGER